MMGFDLASAKPVAAAAPGGGFDLSTAKPVAPKAIAQNFEDVHPNFRAEAINNKKVLEEWRASGSPQLSTAPKTEDEYNKTRAVLSALNYEKEHGRAAPELPKPAPPRKATKADLENEARLRAPDRTWRDDNLLGNAFGVPDAAMGVVGAMATPVIAVPGGFIKSAISGGDPEQNASDIAERISYKPATGTGAQLLRGIGAVAAPLGALPSTHMLQTGQAMASAAPGLRAMTGVAASQAAAQAAPAAAKISQMVQAPLAAAGKVAAYPVNVAKSVVQPFTKAGQDAISGKIIQKFAEDGPTTLNTAQMVEGSSPTLAEATGNAGLARLQSATRDLAPNRFVEREVANARARSAKFNEVAGDKGKLDFFKQDRETVARDLYSDASNVNPGQKMTPAMEREISTLMERPSIQRATAKAKEFALERGEKPSPDGSMRGMHDTKTALDDMISKAVRDGEGGHAAALQATKDSLVNVMEKISPKYGEARATYAEMSKPINQMEVLQGLKLTDAKGIMTLQKVQSAIDTIEKRMAKPGIDPAKALTADQIGTLNAIRDDLLRQSNLGLGKSAGSNTFQNLATDNIISTILPGKLGELVKDKAGGAIGQIGKLAYSGSNEAIKGRLVDKMLTPELAAPELQKLSTMAGKKKAGK